MTKEKGEEIPFGMDGFHAEVLNTEHFCCEAGVLFTLSQFL
jgi:hypothetical protein